MPANSMVTAASKISPETEMNALDLFRVTRNSLRMADLEALHRISCARPPIHGAAVVEIAGARWRCHHTRAGIPVTDGVILAVLPSAAAMERAPRGTCYRRTSEASRSRNYPHAILFKFRTDILYQCCPLGSSVELPHYNAKGTKWQTPLQKGVYHTILGVQPSAKRPAVHV